MNMQLRVSGGGVLPPSVMHERTQLSVAIGCCVRCSPHRPKVPSRCHRVLCCRCLTAWRTLACGCMEVHSSTGPWRSSGQLWGRWGLGLCGWVVTGMGDEGRGGHDAFEQTAHVPGKLVPPSTASWALLDVHTRR